MDVALGATPADNDVLAFDTATGKFINQTAAQAGLASSAAAGSPTGSVAMNAASAAPAGWLTCDGAAVSRTTYAALFAVLGTIWGAGNGSTTFNLPDMRGRVPVGVGTGAGLTARALAATGGEETHVLSEAELAEHTHTYGEPQSSTGFDTNIDGSSNTGFLATLSGGVTGIAGSNAGHNNMQPFAVISFIVKT